MDAKLIQLVLVEDNPGDAYIIQDMLRQIQSPSMQFTHVERLDDALQTLQQASIDAVLLDLSLPDSYGLETLLSLQSEFPALPIVILTGTNDEKLAIQAVQQGAQDYLIKGQVSKYGLSKAIRYAIERKKIELELKQRTFELEQANQTLEQRTVQLEFANQELEAFNYAVSHDLANPLTTILAYTSLIDFQYSERIDQQIQRYVIAIAKAAGHINQLIHDLLRLSQTSRSELQIESVEFSHLAQEILLDFQQSQPNRSVDIVIQPNLVAKGDENLLVIALENLLGNAWKYTSKQQQPYIEFGTVSSETAEHLPLKPLPTNQSIFFIRDNGAGFDMTKAKNLFRPFQRLHKPQDFEGSGVGLATVQRIIHRHGGEIWAEAAIDQGATFYFTLPQS
ncbi:MAG: ATP-binding protein [Cyanobacteria bacterium P01_F01_bin.116]